MGCFRMVGTDGGKNGEGCKDVFLLCFLFSHSLSLSLSFILVWWPNKDLHFFFFCYLVNLRLERGCFGFRLIHDVERWLSVCFLREPLITNIMWRNLIIQVTMSYYIIFLGTCNVSIADWALLSYCCTVFFVCEGSLSSQCPPCPQLLRYKYSSFEGWNQEACNSSEE